MRWNAELKKLWEESGGTLARASLVNFAIYSEEPDSVARNTGLISQITEDLACRAIVINVNRAAKNDHVQAWINAHCHARSDKASQVCSEQLSFVLEGPCVNLLSSIVFSHLDSDLPFYLWWQGEFHDPMDSQLWAWVDRLIYDSQSWQDFRAQLRLLAGAQSDAKNRVVLCDLNWTRLVPVRMALAQFFDHPASRHHLGKFDHCEIDFAPGYRSTALLLAGWLAAQLDWKLEKESRNFALNFSDKTGRRVQDRVEPKWRGADQPLSFAKRSQGISRHPRSRRRLARNFMQPTRGREHAATHARRRERSSCANQSGIDARRPASRLLARARAGT